MFKTCFLDLLNSKKQKAREVSKFTGTEYIPSTTKFEYQYLFFDLLQYIENYYLSASPSTLRVLYVDKLSMLRVSCLKLAINEFRCYEAEIEESEKGQRPPGVEPRTPLA